MHTSPAVLPDMPVASASGGWWAVCLCADWCGTGGQTAGAEAQEVLERVRAARAR